LPFDSALWRQFGWIFGLYQRTRGDALCRRDVRYSFSNACLWFAGILRTRRGLNGRFGVAWDTSRLHPRVPFPACGTRAQHAACVCVLLYLPTVRRRGARARQRAARWRGFFLLDAGWFLFIETLPWRNACLAHTFRAFFLAPHFPRLPVRFDILFYSFDLRLFALFFVLRVFRILRRSAVGCAFALFCARVYTQCACGLRAGT